jgi:hypothetical protein
LNFVNAATPPSSENQPMTDHTTRTARADRRSALITQTADLATVQSRLDDVCALAMQDGRPTNAQAVAIAKASEALSRARALITEALNVTFENV